jgi:hypothetical protein
LALDAAQGTERHELLGMRYRGFPRFDRVNQLDVRASLTFDAPSVCMQAGEDLSGVHVANLPPLM